MAKQFNAYWSSKMDLNFKRRKRMQVGDVLSKLTEPVFLETKMGPDSATSRKSKKMSLKNKIYDLVALLLTNRLKSLKNFYDMWNEQTNSVTKLQDYYFSIFGHFQQWKKYAQLVPTHTFCQSRLKSGHVLVEYLEGGKGHQFGQFTSQKAKKINLSACTVHEADSH